LFDGIEIAETDVLVPAPAADSARRTRSSGSTTRSSGARWSASSPNEDAIVRLIGAILLEQNDEWAIRRARYMTLETIAPLSDDPAIRLPGNRQLTRPAGERGVSPPAQGHDHGDMYGYSLWCLFCRSPQSLQIGRPPVTVQEQRIFSAEGLKVVPIFTKTQATLSGRSANEQRARPGSSFQSFLLAPFHWQRCRPRSSHHDRRGWSRVSMHASSRRNMADA
jgi:hypothetical protein